MIISIVRNVLQIQSSAKNVVDTYKDSLQTRLYQNFSKEGGMFDALIFLCQDMQASHNKTLKLVYLEIYYCVLSSFPASFLFGSNAEEEYFKKMRERERFNKLKRQSELSSRHSRFGAMFEVKRKIGGSSAITGSVNFKATDLLKLDKQKNKPKPNTRHAAKADTQVLGTQIVDENFGVLNEEERKLQAQLKHFVADFLEHAYESVIDAAFDQLNRFDSAAATSDFMHYFVVLAFGIECYCLEFDRASAGSPADALISRPILEQGMIFKFAMVIHGIQVTLIDLLYKTLKAAIDKKKSEFDVKVYHACLLYLRQVLASTAILGRSSYPNDQKNAQMLKQVVFSKEFAKILKVGFAYYEPRLHGRRYGESLVQSQEAFFGLLATHAKDKVLSVATDKLVKKAARRAKRDSGPSDAHPAADGEANSQNGDVDSLDEAETYEDRDFQFKERKYNYYSEFSSFVIEVNPGRLPNHNEGFRPDQR